MTEKSLLWTTGGAGDGANTYTRSDWRKILQIVASSRVLEGITPSYLDELVGSVPGANTARIGTGAALVDGKPYENSAPVDVTIASAVGAGNTRIDRIVLRADWTAQTVRITLISGTDAVSPTAPAITQTSETTYDFMLYQALVTVSGTVTLTDERVMADIVTGGISTAMIADDAITADKIPDASITEAKMAQARPYSVQVTRTGTPVVTSDYYYFPFDVENFDDDAMHDNSANTTRLTCKRAGRYLILFNTMSITSYGSTPTHLFINIVKNRDSDFVFSRQNVYSASGLSPYANMACYAYLDVDDYVEIEFLGAGSGIAFQVNDPVFSMIYDG